MPIKRENLDVDWREMKFDRWGGGEGGGGEVVEVVGNIFFCR